MTPLTGVFRVTCPGEETGAGLAPACWPDQKTVRPLGRDHHRSGGLVFEASSPASGEGYAQLLRSADLHAPGRRVCAVEGSGSFGAGLTRFLADRGELVLEVGRLRRERSSGGKTDALDAIRAARSVLAQQRPAAPRVLERQYARPGDRPPVRWARRVA